MVKKSVALSEKAQADLYAQARIHARPGCAAEAPSGLFAAEGVVGFAGDGGAQGGLGV